MKNAQVVELVDTLASGASGRMAVGVQVSPWAPSKAMHLSNPQKMSQPNTKISLFDDYPLIPRVNHNCALTGTE